MNGLRWGVLAPVLAALWLAACGPVARGPGQPVLVEWKEQRLVFVADHRMGMVRSFFLSNGSPVFFAQSPHGERSSVRDLQVDPAKGELWVLGDDGVTVYSARELKRLRHYAVDIGRADRLQRDADGVVLLSASGERLARIRGVS